MSHVDGESATELRTSGHLHFGELRARWKRTVQSTCNWIHRGPGLARLVILGAAWAVPEREGGAISGPANSPPARNWKELGRGTVSGCGLAGVVRNVNHARLREGARHRHSTRRERSSAYRGGVDP